MKNKTLMKALSALLSVVMVLCSAPLSGFVGLKFPELKLTDWFDFNIKVRAESYSGTCGTNVKWSLDTETGVLNITGTGEMTNYISSSNVPWYSYRNSIKTLNIARGVTSIGNYAFYSCSSLTSIIIPDNVTSIGGYAFYNCTGVKEFTMPVSAKIYNYYNSQYTFYNCTNIEKVTLTKGIGTMQNYGTSSSTSATDTYYRYTPWYISRNSIKEIIIEDGVKRIGNYAFYSCSGLTSITIPGNVTSIGDYAFYNCTSLSEVIYTGDITSWCNISFYDSGANPMRYAESFYINNVLVTEIVIPGTVTEIKDYTFYGFGCLTSTTILDGVVNIGDSVFSNCTSLTSITIPDSVTSIGDSAFYDCGSLVSVAIGNSVTSVGDSAFYNCDSLTSITIPDSVTSVGDSAFYNCDSLTSITIPDSVTSIGDSVFSDCDSLTSVAIGNSVTSVGDSAFYDCDSLTSITIPDSVTGIGDDAFYYCTSLTSATIGKSVTYIGDDAFHYCTSLTLITIPDSVTSIGRNAFCDCTSLASVAIGNSVTYVDDYAFRNCTSLASVAIGNSVTRIGNAVFNDCDRLKCIYYAGSEEDEDKISIGDYNYSLIGVVWIYNCVVNEDGFVFLEKDEYVSLELYTGSLSYITIPETFNDKKVTRIRSGAFDYTEVYKNQENWENGCLYIGDFLYSVSGNVTGTFAVKDGTKYICDEGFGFCQDITTVLIPASVEGIGENAFYGCSGLARVYYNGDIESWCSIDFVDASANPFCYADNFYIDANLVTEIVIPDTITEIKPYAFYDYGKLEKITIPDSVTKFGTNAFRGCAAIKEVYYEGTVAEWCEIQFADIYSTPTADLYIGGEKLINLTVPASVGEVLPSAFYGCTSIQSVVISDGIEAISDNAFAYCENLSTILIPDSVKAIGNNAFYYCRKLNEVSIPGSVETIGDSAFYDCWSIDKLSLGDGIKSIGSSAFRNCDNLVNVTIPGTIETISPYAFHYCDKLNNVIIKSGVKIIGNNAFYNCYNLVSVTVPNTVTTIGENAFYNCNSIENIYYDGTQQEWIQLAIYTGNDSIVNSFVLCEHVHYYTLSETVQPSCDQVGARFYTCSCGDSYSDVIPAPGHTNGEWTVQYAPECEWEGRETIRCTVCGEVIESREIPATGHTWGEWIVKTEPTETSTGLARRTCSVCSDYENKTLAKLVIVNDTETGVQLVYGDELAPGTIMEVESVTDNRYFQILSNEFGEINSEVFNISLYADGAMVQPNGKVKVKIPMPESFGDGEFSACYIDALNGEITKLPVNVEDGYIIFETDHFSIYAVVEQLGKVEKVSMNDFTMEYKSTYKLNPNITIADDIECKTEYKSLNPSVATVDKNGNVTATGTGETEITVTVTDEYGNIVEDTCKVTVSYAWWQWLIIIFLFGFIWY